MSNEEVLNDLLKDKIKAKLGDSTTQTSTGTDEIICIVDRSGSMASMQVEAQGGLNAFVEEQCKVGKANLTIVEFDSYVDVVCEQVDINKASAYELKPRGMTALLDAIGLVISNNEKYTAKDGKTIVVVMTDGMENASKEWTRPQINKLINERKEEGWEFMFLAAGQNAIEVGTSYGFDANSTVTFSDTGLGATNATEVASVYTASLRTMSKSAALGAKTSYINANVGSLSEVGNIGDMLDEGAGGKSPDEGAGSKTPDEGMGV